MAGQDMNAILLRPRIEDPDQRGRTMDPINLGIFFCEFNRCGRQIFDMPSALVEMFRHTDVDDIPLDSLQFPYDCFYLYFGPQLDLETKPGWHPDGAYVTVLGSPKHIQMLLTSAPPDKGTYALWYSYGEPIYVQAMSPEQTKIGVGEAAEMVLAEKIKTLRAQIDGKSSVVSGVEAPDGMTIIDATKRNAAAELATLPTKYAAWREMLKLVVNAIAYLSAYPEDIEPQWPANTPQSLYLQVKDGLPKQKQRARSKLAALGFTAIHMCGTQFRDKESTGRVNLSAERKPTWVRGHWVRQPYGPQHSLRRLQWRMPHLRNAAVDDSATNETGHIYLVS